MLRRRAKADLSEEIEKKARELATLHHQWNGLPVQWLEDGLLVSRKQEVNGESVTEQTVLRRSKRIYESLNGSDNFVSIPHGMADLGATWRMLEDVDLPGHSTSAAIGSNPVLGRILFWPVVPQTVAGQLKRKASQTALLTVIFIKTDLYDRNTQSGYC